MRALRSLIFCWVFFSASSYAGTFDSICRDIFFSNKTVAIPFQQYNNGQLSKNQVLTVLANIRYLTEVADYSRAFAALKSVKPVIRHSDEEVKGIYNLVLARLNYRIGNSQKALLLNLRAIALLQKSHSTETLQLAYCNQLFFLTPIQPDEAEKYLIRARILKKRGIRMYQNLLASNTSFFYLMKGDPEKAAKACSELEQQLIYDQWANALDTYRLYILKASIAESKKELNEEKKFLEKAKEIAVRHLILDNWKQVVNSQSVNALQEKRFSEAYRLLREKDSLNELLPNQQIAEFLVKMELDEQIDLEKAENRFLQTNLATKRRELFFVIGVSVLLLIVLILLLLQRFSIKNKQRIIVKQQVAIMRRTEPDTEPKTVNLNLIQELETLVRDKKLYEQNHLTIERLAKKLNTNRTYLSECINLHYQINYSQWLSGVRIEAAKKLLIDKNYDHWSIEGISQTVGFSSISSFNSTFKRETGLTPSQFRKMSRNFV